jgi:P4 family phage/plasmid primase-like protien
MSVDNETSQFNIREYAINDVYERNQFHNTSFGETLKGERECYESLFLHTQDLISYAKLKELETKKKSVRGYQGVVASDALIIDIDNKDNLAAAQAETVSLVNRLIREYDVPSEFIRINFSGNKGFHVNLPEKTFDGFTPSKDLPAIHSLIVEKLCAGYEQSIDYSIYNRVGLIRIENTQHGKTGNYAIPITLDELTICSIAEIKTMAASVRDIPGSDITAIKASAKLVQLKNDCMVQSVTVKTPDESEATAFSKCDPKNWNKMFKYCHRLQEIQHKSETKERINHEERVFLGTIGTAFGESGIEKVHELLKDQDNYNPDTTDYYTRSMMNCGYKPTLCNTICGAGNLCGPIKTINRRSPIAFSYTYDAKTDEPIDKFIETYVIERILRYFDDLIYSSVDETYYKYDNGVYNIMKDDDIRMRVEQFLKYYIPKQLITNNRLDNLVKRMKIQPQIRFTGMMNAEMYKVNLKNGIFDLHSRTLGPHTKELKSTIQLPFAYNPKATCPTFDAFLNDIFDGDTDTIQYILKFICYLLLPTYAFQKVLVWVGSGRNGKGTLGRIITNLLGPANVASEDLHALANEQFSAIHLRNKLVNFSTELKTADLELDMIKKLSGGDMISARDLYKSAVQFQNIARLIIMANELPRFSEIGNAILERFEFIIFPKQYNGKAADTGLDEKLNAELSGIFNKAIEKMPDIIGSDNRIYFEVPQVITDHKNAVLSELNTVVEFKNECCSMAQNGGETLQDLFKAYCEWSKENNYRAVGKKNFRKVLEQTLKMTVVNSTAHKNRVYVKGIICDYVSSILNHS